MSIFIGDESGMAKNIKKLYVGDENNIAREVNILYSGSDNATKKIYEKINSYKVEKVSLPSGYTQVEYIHNPNKINFYIKSTTLRLIAYNYGYSNELIFRLKTGGTHILYGGASYITTTSGSTKKYFRRTYRVYSNTVHLGSMSINQEGYGIWNLPDLNDNNVHKINILPCNSMGLMTIDDNITVNYSGFYGTDPGYSHRCVMNPICCNLYLFAVTTYTGTNSNLTSGTPSNTSDYYFYRLTSKDNNNEIVSDLIPCIEDSTNTPGVYDIGTSSTTKFSGDSSLEIGPIVR